MQAKARCLVEFPKLIAVELVKIIKCCATSKRNNEENKCINYHDFRVSLAVKNNKFTIKHHTMVNQISLNIILLVKLKECVLSFYGCSEPLYLLLLTLEISYKK